MKLYEGLVTSSGVVVEIPQCDYFAIQVLSTLMVSSGGTDDLTVRLQSTRDGGMTWNNDSEPLGAVAISGREVEVNVGDSLGALTGGTVRLQVITTTNTIAYVRLFATTRVKKRNPMVVAAMQAQATRAQQSGGCECKGGPARPPPPPAPTFPGPKPWAWAEVPWTCGSTPAPINCLTNYHSSPCATVMGCVGEEKTKEFHKCACQFQADNDWNKFQQCQALNYFNSTYGQVPADCAAQGLTSAANWDKCSRLGYTTCREFGGTIADCSQWAFDCLSDPMTPYPPLPFL